jgi:hydrogenase-4 component E
VVSSSLLAQLLSGCAGLELLTALLLVWRSSPRATGRLLGLQGGALAGLITVLALGSHSPELLVMAGFVLVLKAVLLPRLLAGGLPGPTAERAGPVHGGGVGPAARPARRPDPTLPLLAVAVLASLAYLVSRPVAALVPGPAGRAVPVGFVVLLTGFLVLVTRRRAHAQLVGFLMVDNGIATVAYLTSDGVPLVVELGAGIDVLLVVLVLQVLGGRMRIAFGGHDLDDLRELHD